MIILGIDPGTRRTGFGFVSIKGGVLRHVESGVVAPKRGAPLPERLLEIYRELLELIERHRVTHSQWVPTMFVRMLKLPDEERTRHDLSSHRVAIHAAAPCPVEVKRRMIEWWGPVIHETYSASDGGIGTLISSEEWLEKPGGSTLIATSRPSTVSRARKTSPIPPEPIFSIIL